MPRTKDIQLYANHGGSYCNAHLRQMEETTKRSVWQVRGFMSIDKEKSIANPLYGVILLGSYGKMTPDPLLSI